MIPMWPELYNASTALRSFNGMASCTYATPNDAVCSNALSVTPADVNCCSMWALESGPRWRNTSGRPSAPAYVIMSIAVSWDCLRVGTKMMAGFPLEHVLITDAYAGRAIASSLAPKWLMSNPWMRISKGTGRTLGWKWNSCAGPVAPIQAPKSFAFATDADKPTILTLAPVDASSLAM
jgi:hypothetical protein